jgi:hypothetical protein
MVRRKARENFGFQIAVRGALLEFRRRCMKKHSRVRFPNSVSDNRKRAPAD